MNAITDDVGDECYYFDKPRYVPKPKVKDWDKFIERGKQYERFVKWCEDKGYFTHAKYFETWLAALEIKEE